MVANYRQFHVQSLRNATGPDQRFGRLQKLAQDGFHQHLVSLHGFLNDKKCHLSGIYAARRCEAGHLAASRTRPFCVGSACCVSGRNRPIAACHAYSLLSAILQILGWQTFWKRRLSLGAGALKKIYREKGADTASPLARTGLVGALALRICQISSLVPSSMTRFAGMR